MTPAALAVAVVLSCPFFVSLAGAHFVWVEADGEGDAAVARVYFGESAAPGGAELIERIAHAKVWSRSPDGTLTERKTAVSTKEDEGFLSAELGGAAASVEADCLYGVFSRGETSMLLHYYAKSLGGESLDKPSLRRAKKLALDVVPRVSADELSLTVLWKGEPAAECEVVVKSPQGETQTLATDKTGIVRIASPAGGRYEIRARLIEERAGTHDGRDYQESRHYSTLVLNLPSDRSSAGDVEARNKNTSLPDLPEALTSFGAAVSGGKLYVYGGHTAEAHSYSIEEQSGRLLALDLKQPEKWTTAAEGQRLQGLALVAHGGMLYRVGGFAAKNAKGEEHDLWSQDDFAAFDPRTGQWKELPSLPEPRSSHDAAVVGNLLCVAGGWQLRGDEDSLWHEKAWSLDLAAEKPKWQPLPQPPFQRRALALAAHDGKLYVIGGMQKDGGPTTQVDVYDPQDGTWKEGPSLEGEPMTGFGSSAFAAGGRLFVSTVTGSLQRLTEDGAGWETVQELDPGRFFHRMLPLGERRLVLIAGANMSIGKFRDVQVIDLKR